MLFFTEISPRKLSGRKRIKSMQRHKDSTVFEGALPSLNASTDSEKPQIKRKHYICVDKAKNKHGLSFQKRYMHSHFLS